MAPLSGLKIQGGRKLWCRSQVQLGSGVAVAVAGSCSSDLTLSLGTSICHRCGCKKKKICIEGLLIYVVLVFRVQQSNSVIYIIVFYVNE